MKKSPTRASSEAGATLDATTARLDLVRAEEANEVRAWCETGDWGVARRGLPRPVRKARP